MTHDNHYKVHLHLSSYQLSRARNGHPIQLKHEQINTGHHISIHAHPETFKKILKAHKNKRGVRLHLTEHEMMHGTGFFDNVKNFLKKNGTAILDTVGNVASAVAPEYKDIIQAGRQGIKNLTGYGHKRHEQHAHHLHHPHATHHIGHHAHPMHDHHGGGVMYSPNVNESIRFMPGNLAKDGFHGIGVRKHHKKAGRPKKQHMHGMGGEGIFPAGY